MIKQNYKWSYQHNTVVLLKLNCGHNSSICVSCSLARWEGDGQCGGEQCSAIWFQARLTALCSTALMVSSCQTNSPQRWTIGSNLEPDRSGPLELWRLQLAPEIWEMELFGSDCIGAALFSITFCLLYPVLGQNMTIKHLWIAWDTYKRGSKRGSFSRHWLATLHCASWLEKLRAILEQNRQ